MSQENDFTMEQLYKRMCDGKLFAARCRKCGRLHLPPRPMCDLCYSKDFEWIEVPPKGKLLTYTIIHVAPVQLQSLAPYAMGIVEFEESLKLLGMIRNIPFERLKVGMPLSLVFEAPESTQHWPHWPRYFFEAAKTE